MSNVNQKFTLAVTSLFQYRIAVVMLIVLAVLALMAISTMTTFAGPMTGGAHCPGC